MATCARERSDGDSCWLPDSRGSKSLSYLDEPGTKAGQHESLSVHSTRGERHMGFYIHLATPLRSRLMVRREVARGGSSSSEEETLNLSAQLSKTSPGAILGDLGV